MRDMVSRRDDLVFGFCGGSALLFALERKVTGSMISYYHFIRSTENLLVQSRVIIHWGITLGQAMLSILKYNYQFETRPLVNSIVLIDRAA